MFILVNLETMANAIERAQSRRVIVRSSGDDCFAVLCDNPLHAPHVVSYVERQGILYAECDCAGNKARRPCYHIAHAYYQRLHALEVLRAAISSPAPSTRPMDTAVLHTGGINLQTAKKIRGIRI
jgi:hypothetical protein